MESNFIILIFFLVAIGIFFLCRELICWYWKINQHLENQEIIIRLLRQLVIKSDSSDDSQSADLTSILDDKAANTEEQAKTDKKKNEGKMMYALYGVIVVAIIIAYLLSK